MSEQLRQLLVAATLSAAILNLPFAHAGEGSLQPVRLQVEYSDIPLGIDAKIPRLSWQGSSTVRGAAQSGYRIQVAASAADLEAGKLLWDSGEVQSDRSLFVPYQGPAPASGERVVWRVKLKDQAGRDSDWSNAAFWEMGLLEPADWRASWVRHPGPADTGEQRPATMLRRSFTLDGEVQRARLYATALGIYEFELNGKPVGDQVLAPGWTSYGHRVQYQTYDVTDSLVAGDNAIGALLADGWYRGHLGWENNRDVYGKETALRAQLHVTYADGREVVIGTDTSWKASRSGPYRAADLYDGEVYDARRRIAGWSDAGFDDGAWQAAAQYDAPPVDLVAPQGPPVRRMEEVRPVAITTAPNGETLVDMGQNMVGWVRLRLRGKEGAEVVIRHAEVLDPEGNLYTENLRSADATDRYILAGGGEEVYEPRFSFHGFRYVGLSGYPGKLALEDITGIVIYSAMRRTGSWESSNPLLNQLYSNIVWGQKGNFVDIPTDCPQRDERLGWTGDAQVFAPTAAFNMDVSGFFAKWLRDLALDQSGDGSVPHVVPDIFKGQSGGTAGWGDAATVVPWAVYRAYADDGLLARQLPSMKAWVDYIASQAGESLIWRTGRQFGDWLAPELTHFQRPYIATTGSDLIATAYFAHSADLVSRAAAALGDSGNAQHYRELFEKVKAAFRREFMTASGRVLYETQTAYVLALAFDLLPEAEREAAAARLAADVNSRGKHLTTGFLGTPELTRVLAEHGQLGTAYDLLTQTTYPSWLYPVTHGATTIWERWDAVRTDGSFQNPEMTSFNHYAYGAIGQWMVDTVAGLGAASPGYRTLHIAPRPGGGLSHAAATLLTPYGEAASSWSVRGAKVSVDATVPPNTSATVVLPLAAGRDVRENDVALDAAPGVVSVAERDGDLVVEVGSGSYRFGYDSEALAFQAADFRELTAATPLPELLKVPEVMAIIEQRLPPQMLAQISMVRDDMTLATMQHVDGARDAAEAVIAALPDINRQRRAAVLATGD